MRSSDYPRLRIQLGKFALFAFAALQACCCHQQAIAKTHSVRGQGRTLVEAESFSAKSSDGSPRVQQSDKCSGKQALGYFWPNNWFELKLEVEQTGSYHMLLRASSEQGTKLQIKRINDSGTEELLATIDVPKTGNFESFINVSGPVLQLPAGVCNLRFENQQNGLDVDFVMFSTEREPSVSTYSPPSTDGPDINPLKGLASGWWRDTDDYASVGFQYLEWGRLEPNDDQFDWDYIEEVLDRPGTRGRHVILQFVVDWDDWGMKQPSADSHYKGPKWLLDIVGEERGPAFPDDPNSRISRATKYDHPQFIEEAKEAIDAICNHFRDDPRVFVIQTGLIGYWGEWHNFPRTDWSPTPNTKRAILDAYKNALGEIGLTQFRYPEDPIIQPRLGMGYTNGYATLTDHGREFNEAIAANSLWKNGPIGGEWPPNIEPELWQEFFATSAGKGFVEQAHYSSLLMPETKDIAKNIPGWQPDDSFMQLHRRFGYNFQVSQVRHVESKKQPGLYSIEVQLKNTGIAPFYKKWDVQIAILDAQTNKLVDLIKLDTDIRELGPDQQTTLQTQTNIQLDPATRYHIGLRIIQPGSEQPKPAPWKLNARNAYIVLANELSVIDGHWTNAHALEGGWNLLNAIAPTHPNTGAHASSGFQPLQGSFRPTGKDGDMAY